MTASSAPSQLTTPMVIDAAGAAMTFEPAFAAFPRTLLHLALDGEAAEAMLVHLGYRVRRAPGELVSHARRILLAHRLGDTATSCAALIDLACALGDKGTALRRSLFDEVADAQPPARRALLEALLERAPDVRECEAVHATLLRPAVSPGALLRRLPRSGDDD